MLHSDRRTLQNAVRNVLDGELLNKYLYLSTMERSELAKKIGTTQDIVSMSWSSALCFGGQFK
jgi:cleavage and polyadenylation specificity factor subunit 1